MFTIAPQSNTPITIDPFKIKQPFQKHYPAKGEELGEFINEVEDDFEDDENEYPLDYSKQSNSNQSNPNNIEIEDDLNSDDEVEEDEDDYVTIEDEVDDDEIVTGMGY